MVICNRLFRTRNLSRASVFVCAVLLSASIVSENNSGFDESERRVIRDAIAWAGVWAQIYENGSSKPPLPGIDFSKEQVVVAALGTRPSSGHSIRITGASGSGNAIKVKLESESPGSGCVVLTVITHPVTVAKMGRTVGSVVFEETPIVKNCG